jgi:hypothetical protein
MKNRFGTLRKIKKTLPLEGGGKRVGVKGLTGVARKLRRHSTDTEGHLWSFLRDRQIEGLKFRRQHPIGSYVVDFVNLEKKVVIELDGGSMRSNQAIGFAMNGSELKGIGCCDSGITRYSPT